MTYLQVTINNLKEVLIAADLVLQKLEKAQKDLEKPVPHIWEQGDVLRSKNMTLMICIRDLSASPGRLQVYCVEHNGCDGRHPTQTILETAEFLFNIKEKL